jgi:cell division protein FtsN
MTDKKPGLMKDGTRRSSAGAKGGRGGGMPRIMWLAIVACIAGAVYLFGNQNGDVPTGIGENQTVVTAPDVESNLGHDEGPRSGDVDITEQANALTPEAGNEQAKTQPAADKPAETKTVITNPPPVRKITEEAPPALVPAASGPYAAQIGSFGKPDNADKEAARLQKLGWDARVKVGNTSNGSFVYRVHIGYFKSRGEAEKFIRQNRKQMTGAIAVHR